MFGDGITKGRPVCVEVHRRATSPASRRPRAGADLEVLVEEARQLADRHAVAHRDRELPDERLVAWHEHRPLDVDAADRIRPVAHDDGDAVLARTRAGSWPSCRCRCRCARRCPAGRSPSRRRGAACRRSARAFRCRARTPAPCAGSRCACGVSIMLSCTSDRKPCCGPKIAPSVTSGDAIRASTMCVKWASTEAGLLTMPTRRPFSLPEANSRDEPSVTATREL